MWSKIEKIARSVDVKCLSIAQFKSNVIEKMQPHVDAIEAHYEKVLTFVENVSLQPEVGKWKKS